MTGLHSLSTLKAQMRAESGCHNWLAASVSPGTASTHQSQLCWDTEEKKKLWFKGEKEGSLGSPVSQLKRLALDFGSGHDLRVLGSSPVLGSLLSVESAWDSSLLLFLPLSPSLSNKLIFLKSYVGRKLGPEGSVSPELKLLITQIPYIFTW